MGSKGGYLIGFDLGGTKMLCGLLDEKLSIVATSRAKTGAHEGQDAVVGRIIDLIRGTLERNGIAVEKLAGVGIAVPGPVSPDLGVVHQTPNMPFHELPLRDLVEKALGAPVVLENDVNAGTYGEFIGGAARGYRDIVGIFPGTGIGGGLILDGRLYRGRNGRAGEVGHMIIQVGGPRCGCGQYGCLEALASRTAMAKDAAAIAAAGGAPATLELAGTDLKNYRAKVFLKAKEAGDTEVIKVIERSAHFLGIGIANCVNTLDPEIVVLGGGIVEKLGDYYVDMAAVSMRSHAMPNIAKGVKVVSAELGDDAVIIGAAGIAGDSKGAAI